MVQKRYIFTKKKKIILKKCNMGFKDDEMLSESIDKYCLVR